MKPKNRPVCKNAVAKALLTSPKQDNKRNRGYALFGAKLHQVASGIDQVSQQAAGPCVDNGVDAQGDLKLFNPTS